MLKYWLKLQKSDNCVFKGLYENLFRAQSDNYISNWLSEMRKMLISIAINDVWQQQTVKKKFLFIAKQSLKYLTYQKLTVTCILTIQTSV